MHIDTFHDPILSCAQAALHQVLLRHRQPDTEHLSTAHPAMLGVVAHGKRRAPPASHGHGKLIGGIGKIVGKIADGMEAEAEKLAAEIEGIISKCAELYVDYCYASWTGNEAEKQKLYEELKFSTCDPLWAEAIIEYEELKVSHGQVQYVQLQWPTGLTEIADTVKIAIVGDWGTGTALAQGVLEAAAAHQPDLVIHLGDIYYAGTPAEEGPNFLALLNQVFPGDGGKPGIPVYNLPGNHDYYSGGQGFFNGLGVLGVQTGSYFCLRTAQWQVIGLDTGYHDRDPFTVDSNITFLTKDQVEWLREAMGTCGSRRTVLLTHHQLYSAAGDVGQTKEPDGETVYWGVNPYLHKQLKPYFGQVDLWLWGHEHNTVVFYSPVDAQGKLDMPAGRCIGSGAIPMLMAEDPYTPATGLVGPDGIAVPQMNMTYQLGNDGTDYNHSFAILSLGSSGATVDYYQVPQQGAASLLLSEPVPPPITTPTTAKHAPAAV
ncbi:MAG TPA: metallophosphoesterase [Longimicrobiaceae bacterium]|nr:metallophosphoesterase [Longimicrobiaceae bacterium]